MESKFSEEDKKKVIEFLNIIAQKSEFNLNTQEVIKYYGLLSYMQQELLPKIDSHIMEVTKVVEAEPEKKESKAKKGKK